jgi:hypothetical protein
MEKRELYDRLGSSLKTLLDELQSNGWVGLRKEGERIFFIAAQIGGPIQQEAALLIEKIGQFLKTPEDRRLGLELAERALKIEQQTREI